MKPKPDFQAACSALMTKICRLKPKDWDVIVTFIGPAQSITDHIGRRELGTVASIPPPQATQVLVQVTATQLEKRADTLEQTRGMTEQ